MLLCGPGQLCPGAGGENKVLCAVVWVVFGWLAVVWVGGWPHRLYLPHHVLVAYNTQLTTIHTAALLSNAAQHNTQSRRKFIDS